jgi:hypothetical protein
VKSWSSTKEEEEEGELASSSLSVEIEYKVEGIANVAGCACLAGIDWGCVTAPQLGETLRSDVSSSECTQQGEGKEIRKVFLLSLHLIWWD